MKKLTRQELFDALEDDVVSEKPAKYGVRITQHIVLDGKDYIVTYMQDHEGIEAGPFCAFEAEKRGRVVVEWVKK